MLQAGVVVENAIVSANFIVNENVMVTYNTIHQPPYGAVMLQSWCVHSCAYTVYFLKLRGWARAGTMKPKALKRAGLTLVGRDRPLGEL